MHTCSLGLDVKGKLEELELLSEKYSPGQFRDMRIEGNVNI